MANKYDLLLVNTLTDKAIREQPWYKERIRTKLIKSMNPKSISKFLNTDSWTFIEDGLGDFRDGLPPTTHDDELIKPARAPAPSLTGDGSTEPKSKIKDIPNKQRFSKDDICFSKVTPLQKQKRNHIDEIEFGLLQHPLALYPHLEKGVDPDLFEDIVDLLDPEMNMDSDDEEDDDNDDNNSIQNDGYDSRDIPSPANASEVLGDNKNIDTDVFKNMYKWLPKKEEHTRKSKKKSQEIRPESPSQDHHIKEVTQDFCGWVASLGGETNNIEESTIYSLFATGYETKPALSVPIHVVELTNVPPELRMSAAVPEQEVEAAKTEPVMKPKKKAWSYSFGNYIPSCAKSDYGAWYLPAKTWKKRDSGAPLLDPQQLKEQDETEMKKKNDDLDAKLTPIHGSTAFMEFINKKNNRQPEFLVKVAKLQKKQREEEERLKLEIEAKARSKSKRKSTQQS